MQNKIILIFILSFVYSIGAFAQLPKDSVIQTKDTAAKNIHDEDSVFMIIETPATFPGGMNGWRKYLENKLNYPEKAQEKGIQGVIRVQLVVTKDGHVTEVKALNNPGGGLAKEAERMLKESPDWIPAEQNGVKVNCRFVQTITFRMM